jgi:hypothetical protein
MNMWNYTSRLNTFVWFVVKVSFNPDYLNNMKGVSTQTFRLIIAQLVGKP